MWLRGIGAASALALSIGVAQAQSQRVPDASEVMQKRFGDWTQRCVQSNSKSAHASATASSAVTACELAHSVQVERGGKRIEVVSLAVSRARDKASQVEWALVAVTPLDVHLPSGFGVAVGKKTVVTAPYRNCNRLGCWAVVPLDVKLLRQFEAGRQAAALFRVLDGKTVRVVFSLRGFTKGLRSLKSGKLPDRT